MRDLIILLAVITWMSGIVLAKGFWSTFFAIWLPPYGWYLVVERVMQAFGAA